MQKLFPRCLYKIFEKNQQQILNSQARYLSFTYFCENTWKRLNDEVFKINRIDMNPWKSNQLHKQKKCKYTEAATGGVFCKLKCSLKFCKAHRKTPVRVSFLIMLQTDACNFIKQETLAQVFSCEFCEISKNTFSIEHLRETASEHSNS